MFMHKNWNKTNLMDNVKKQALSRNLKDLSIGPVFTWNNNQIKEHIDAVLELEGSKVLFGGKPLTGHSIPE